MVAHHLSLSPFRRIVKDYFMVCESYYAAIRTAPPAQIEAIDMGRRGLHNEGSELLRERLKGKIDIDFDTARRLFTLICVLHWKGMRPWRPARPPAGRAVRLRLNAVRSPMAAALFRHLFGRSALCGLGRRPQGRDPTASRSRSWTRSASISPSTGR